MGRVKIKFPSEKPLFTTDIRVRISDINYGNHLGNDAVLSMIHEARMQLLGSWGYTELDAGGCSLIMRDTEIAYRGEAFYGDLLQVDIFAELTGPRSFDLYYWIRTTRKEQEYDIVHARTGMVAFDYAERKTIEISEGLKSKLLL